MGWNKASRHEDSHAVTERLLVWHDSALRAGRVDCGEMLLLLAWRAYDRPPSRAQ